MKNWEQTKSERVNGRETHRARAREIYMKSAKCECVCHAEHQVLVFSDVHDCHCDRMWAHTWLFRISLKLFQSFVLVLWAILVSCAIWIEQNKSGILISHPSWKISFLEAGMEYNPTREKHIESIYFIFLSRRHTFFHSFVPSWPLKYFLNRWWTIFDDFVSLLLSFRMSVLLWVERYTRMHAYALKSIKKHTT